MTKEKCKCKCQERDFGTNSLSLNHINRMNHEEVLTECAKAQYEPYWDEETWLALLKRSDETIEKDFEVRVVAYILSRHIKAESLIQAKNKISDILIKDGGYSTGLIFEGRQIQWLHEKYPRDIGYEPVTEWK